ncbi:hypothetical protein LS73_006355 [Helicobacter muridarum]|uniref:Uncharacterized protein n=1 Tax=Helicobacter muridarum TaxID=216 RepID=A0A4U8TJP7_9HELI|nr:hypothetical protein [Helicobacter muridarum]TLD99924.1 hypothetical protein LS73_006355 [Helicobacter muridarum]
MVNAFSAPSQEIPSITQEAKELFTIELVRMQNTQGRFYNIHIAIPKRKADKKSALRLMCVPPPPFFFLCCLME